ncbi:MAG: glycosyltransferase family 39 protein [Anaerolineae bacterium]|nr:glycosyltransferase family 39 protein [Anaerolineae bacterium]
MPAPSTVRYHRRAQAGLAVGLLALVLLAALPLSPARLNQGRDSGAYAYTAQVLLDGGLPYRDAWDHKPPLIHTLDALALAACGADRWSLWLLAALLTYATALLLYALLVRIQSRRFLAGVGAASVILLVNRPMWGDLNTPELAALPLQALCLLAGTAYLRQPHARWAFLAGLAAGLAFLAKQTTVGVALTLIPALLLARFPPRWLWERRAHLIALVAGGLTGPGIAALVFLAHGALDEAVRAVFEYNLSYNDALSLPKAINTTLSADPVRQVYIPLVFFAVLGIIGAFRPAGNKRDTPATAAPAALKYWLALTLAADFVLTNLSGRGYPHYFLTPLPVFVPLVILGLSAWLDRGWLDRWVRPIRRLSWAYLALVVIVPPLLTALLAVLAVEGRLVAPAKQHALADYVRQHTVPDDTILVWGAISEVYFQSGRRSASRYHYSYPLTTPGYTTGADIRRFVDDLRANRPVLIIDAAWGIKERVPPPLDPALRQDWAQRHSSLPDLGTVFDFVDHYCVLTSTVEDYDIYHCQY